jgi:hypothetical protein
LRIARGSKNYTTPPFSWPSELEALRKHHCRRCSGNRVFRKRPGCSDGKEAELVFWRVFHNNMRFPKDKVGKAIRDKVANKE